MLILCGSLVSLMKSQTLDYSSPLYGRRTGQIKLKQIPFNHYHAFFEGRTNNDLLPFYAVTGGVPKYIETFSGYTDIYKAIEQNVLNSQSFLYEEPYFLLQRKSARSAVTFRSLRRLRWETETFKHCDKPRPETNGTYKVSESPDGFGFDRAGSSRDGDGARKE